MSSNKTLHFAALLLVTIFLSSCIDDKTAPSSDVAATTVAVSIEPNLSTTVPKSGAIAYTASVTGSGNTAVKWSIQEGASGGNITNKGLYTAPATVGTFHVIATSQADPGKSATATVTVSSILDASFASNGSISTPFTSIDIINSIAQQADGKIVVGGYSLNGTETDFALARYLSNGILDTSFGTNGIVVTSLGGSTEIKAITLQDDGKILAGGNTSNTENSNFVLARYLKNGTLDPDFGNNRTGFIKTSINVGNDKLNAIALLPNGKIVAGGFSAVTTTNDIGSVRNKFALVQYQSNGTLDPTFDTDGMLTTAIGTGNEEILALTIDSNGKIIAGGFSSNGSNNDFALARYNSDGSLDTSFDADGKLTTPIGTGNERITSLAIDSSGKIVAGGFAAIGATNDFALARYDSNGSLDTTFDTDGKLTTAIGTSDEEIRALAVRSNDKIIAGGFASFSGNRDFALVAYNADGSLDTSFDTDGKLTTTIGTGTDEINTLLLQPDDKIVVGGFSFVGTSPAFALARYTANGSLDTTFHTDGKLSTLIGGGADEINAVALQADNKIIAAGFTFGTNNIRNKDFALTRYNSDGTLDTTFGNNGKVTTAIGSTASNGHDIINDISIQSVDEKIVAAGSYRNGSNGDDFVLARYTVNGTLDTSFGTGGLVKTTINTNDETINALVLQPDGKIVAAGTSFTTGTAPNHHDFTLARYNTNGTLDTSFGASGIQKTPIDNGSFAEAVVLQSDGKIVVAGSSESNTGFDFALARYNLDGTIDTSFGIDGIVRTPVSTGHDFANAIKIQSDGMIVVSGTSFSGASPEQFAVVRYNSDGSLDSSFGTGGMVTTAIANGAQPFALVIQDGKIVLGGFSISILNNRDFTLVRYLSDGTLDPAFGVNGIEISPFSPAIDEIHDLILSDGQILAAGFSVNGYGENTDFHLARYAP